jgi:hypothetical protein
MMTATLAHLPRDDDHGRELSADELAFRQRFDAPGLWPASVTAQERENFLLWSYIQHVRARWDRGARVLRPSLWLRLRVTWRAAWIGVDDPGTL